MRETDAFARTISACAMWMMLTMPAGEAPAATLISDRASLDEMLGSAGTTEDFEGFGPVYPVLDLGGPGTHVDSTSYPIVQGVAFTSIDGGMRIENLDYLGSSNVLDVGGSGPSSLVVDFDPPATAFGFDFLPGILTGTDVTLILLGPDDQSVVDTVVVRLFHFPTFIGIADSGGIGKALISSVAGDLFPIYGARIDNLTFGIAPPVLSVEIDIKPGNPRNTVNVRSRGVIAVAILSSPDFDAAGAVDPISLTFGKNGDELSLVSCSEAGEDINDDGLTDLVCKFQTRLTGLTSGDVQAILKGRLLDGHDFRGADLIYVFLPGDRRNRSASSVRDEAL